MTLPKYLCNVSQQSHLVMIGVSLTEEQLNVNVRQVIILEMFVALEL